MRRYSRKVNTLAPTHSATPPQSSKLAPLPRPLACAAAVMLALAALPGGAVHAQEPGNAPDPNAEPTMATVTVSARRREESLQDVPVSVTAFSAEQLARQGIIDITGLTTSIPNTTLKPSRGTNTTLTAFIRGVGQQDPLAGFESGVGIYLDDVYIARPQGAVMDVYDVERIEVLRGPQGTLYGRNTIGGAVKYVTRKLANKPDVRVRATLGDYQERDLVLTASTPVFDGLKVGTSVARFKRDGFGRNQFTGEPNYDKDIVAARVSAEYAPNSDLFIRVAGDITQDESHPRQGHRLMAGRTSGTPTLANEYDTMANLNRALGHEAEVKAHGWSVLIEYQLSPTLLFKSISAGRKDRSFAPIDFDSLPVVDFEVPALYENRQKSQEFQFTYTGERIQGVGGFYYMDANAYNIFDTILGGAVPTSTFTRGSFDTKAWALYADASYKLNAAWELSLGGRYTVDKREGEILRQVYLGGAGTPQLGNPPAFLFRTDTDLRDLSRRDKKFTPRLGVAYKVNHAHNVYGSYARGFKGGGFDPRVNVVGLRVPIAQARQGFLPETINTVELGLKSNFGNGRLLTNAALFGSKYRDVQIPGSVAVDTNGDGVDDSFAGVTTNAGRAHIRGVELEAQARVTQAFSVTGMYSHIDADYTRFVTGGVDLASQRFFQNTPRNSANLRANYDFAMPLGGTPGKITLSGNVAHRSFTHQFEFASVLDQDGYTLYDASLIWTSSDGRVRAALHGRNLGDKRYKIGGYVFPTLGNEGVLTAFYGPPRTWSATVDIRF